MHKSSSSAAILVLMLFSACTELYPGPSFGPGPGSQREDSRGINRTSFFMASDRHESGSGNNLTAVLRTAADGASVRPSVVLLDGDHVGGGRDRTPEFSVETIYGEVDSVLTLNHNYILLGYGSHDTNCTEGYPAFLSGPVRCDGYYVYGVSFAQMSFATDSAALAAIEAGHGAEAGDPPGPPPGGESEGERPAPPPGGGGYRGIDTLDVHGISAESGTANFLAWVSSLRDEDPIVVLSHMPMHTHRRDNLGASTWFSALNQAARSHDIVFLWGHNHTLEEHGETVDQDFYLLLPGEEICVQSPVDSVSLTGSAGFTYVNAGYVKLGYASVVTFTDINGRPPYDRIRIERFTINEADSTITRFGTTGHANPYEGPLRPSLGR